MKNRIILVLLLQLIFATTQAQKITNAKILGNWQFTQIALNSFKPGYIPAFEKQEINLMLISMANYTFNEDGSVVLSDDYMKKTGINSATWKLNAAQTGIDITYNFSEEPKPDSINKNKKETLPWKIESVTATDLSISIQKIIVVKFKKAVK